MKRRTVLGGALAAGAARFDAGLSEGAIEQEASDPDLEHRRPGGALQGGVRRVPEEQPRRRNRVARQERTGGAGLLPDAACRRHAAGRHQHCKGRFGSSMPRTAPCSILRHTSSRTPRSPSASTPTTFRNCAYEKKNFMLPFYITKTLLFYNKTMFKEAGLAEPPKSFDEIMSHARSDGERREDRPSDPQLRLAVLALLKMKGVELLSADGKKPPSTRRRRSRSWTSSPRAPRAAPSTRSPGPAAGSSRTAPSPPARSACTTPIRRPTSSSRARGHGSTPTRSASRRCPATGRRRPTMGSASRRDRRTRNSLSRSSST